MKKYVVIYLEGAEKKTSFVEGVNEVEARKNFSRMFSNAPPEKIIKVEDVGIVSRSRYDTGRFAARLISFLGWIMVCVGFIVMATSIEVTLSQYQYGDDKMISVIMAATPGFSAILGGLFSVMSGQAVRAILDISDDVRRIGSVTLP